MQCLLWPRSAWLHAHISLHPFLFKWHNWSLLDFNSTASGTQQCLSIASQCLCPRLEVQEDGIHKQCKINSMVDYIEELEVNKEVDHESALARIECEMEQKGALKYRLQVSPLLTVVM